MTVYSPTQAVQGLTPDGTPVSGNPVLGCGWDGAVVRTVRLTNADPVGNEYGIITRPILEAATTTFGSVLQAGAWSVSIANASAIPVSIVTANGQTLGDSAENPGSYRLVGSPDGDFRGMDLIEQVIDPGTGIRFNTYDYQAGNWYFQGPVASGAAISGNPLYTGFNDAGTMRGVSPTTPLPISMNAIYYPSSTGNNSTAQLAAGARFTGSVETVLLLQAAQIEVVCDQPYTITVNQFIDAAGTQLSSTDTITRAAGQPYNENVTLPGNYFQLIVKNIGTATTKTLVINTTFGIMATGPRTLTAMGNNRSAINEVGGAALALGPQPKTASVPVVITSDQDFTQYSRDQGETLLAILAELRVMNTILAAGLNVPDDLGILRTDHLNLTPIQ